MPAHENKVCERCGCTFECRAGDITQCQCFSVQLNEEERTFVEGRYQDCLCANCLLQLKDKYILFKEKFLHNSK